MEKVTIKVKNGEVTIPTIGKITDKDGSVLKLLCVVPYYGGEGIRYFYPNTCGCGVCSAQYWNKSELEGLEPCSIDFWNETVEASCAECEKNNTLRVDGKTDND